MVHSSLIDVLIQFCRHHVAIITDVSKMYRVVSLGADDHDLHRFVWRENPKEPLCEFWMTRVTFGISASSFAANMALKQNAVDHATKFPKCSQSSELIL